MVNIVGNKLNIKRVWCSAQARVLLCALLLSAAMLRAEAGVVTLDGVELNGYKPLIIIIIIIIIIIMLGTVTSWPTSAGSHTSTTAPSPTTATPTLTTATPTPLLLRLRRQCRNIRATSRGIITFKL